MKRRGFIGAAAAAPVSVKSLVAHGSDLARAGMSNGNMASGALGFGGPPVAGDSSFYVGELRWMKENLSKLTREKAMKDAKEQMAGLRDEAHIMAMHGWSHSYKMIQVTRAMAERNYRQGRETLIERIFNLEEQMNNA